jgi:hypothetical protein
MICIAGPDALPSDQVQREVKEILTGKIVVGHDLRNDFEVNQGKKWIYENVN